MSTKSESLHRSIQEFIPSKQHLKVLAVIPQGVSCTRNEICEASGVSTTSLCARLHELEFWGRIYVADTKWDATSKRHVNAYRKVAP